MTGSDEPQLESANSERRKQTRFPLAFEMTYLVREGARRGETGASQTIDMSSAGLRFLAACPLPVGVEVEVVIDWPIWLHGSVPLQLSAVGTVVRLCGKETVITLQRHTFKTRRTGESLVPLMHAIRTDQMMQRYASAVSPQRRSARSRNSG